MFTLCQHSYYSIHLYPKPPYLQGYPTMNNILIFMIIYDPLVNNQLNNTHKAMERLRYIEPQVSKPCLW